MDFIHFGLRMQIEEMFLDWCSEEGVAEKPKILEDEMGIYSDIVVSDYEVH